MENVGSSLETCVLCDLGEVAAESGARSCERCTSSTDFQPFIGQSQCEKCPAKSGASDDRKTCLCDVGSYAVPLTNDNFLTFLELDPEGYTLYFDSYINAAVVPDFNPNEYLQFWCVRCPVGADCRSIGTTMNNVSSLEDYFIGVDDTGLNPNHP